MRVFIFAGLLACIHGLGDRAPYTNNQNNLWTAAGQLAPAPAGSWQANTCSAGTTQSPINIVTATAAAPVPALPPLVAIGHDQDVPIRLDIDGNLGLPTSSGPAVPPPGLVPLPPVAPVATGLRMTPVTTTQAVISGGPLTGRLVCLKFFSSSISF